MRRTISTDVSRGDTIRLTRAFCRDNYDARKWRTCTDVPIHDASQLRMKTENVLDVNREIHSALPMYVAWCDCIRETQARRLETQTLRATALRRYYFFPELFVSESEMRCRVSFLQRSGSTNEFLAQLFWGFLDVCERALNTLAVPFSRVAVSIFGKSAFAMCFVRYENRLMLVNASIGKELRVNKRRVMDWSRIVLRAVDVRCSEFLILAFVRLFVCTANSRTAV